MSVYRGVPAEERQAERRARLLDAAYELLGSEGWSGTTVRGVCKRANLTPRYFYESFDDLEALIAAVFDRIVAEAAAKVLEAVEGSPADAHATARAAIETFVRYLTDDPRRARIAFAEALGSETLMRRRLDALSTFAELLAGQAREFYGTPRRAETLVNTTAYMLVGGLAELLLAWLDGSLDTTLDQLVEDFTELFVATGESALLIAQRRAAKARRS